MIGRGNLPANAAVTIAAAIVFCLLPAFGPASAQAPAGCQPLPAAQKLDTTAPINVGQLKAWLIHYRCTAYDVDVAKTLAEARAWVAQRASQVAKPAIVLDIDETSLSNWAQIYHNDFAYIPGGACDLKSTSACGQLAWELSASAVALEPTLELFNFAKATKGKDGNSVAIFFVTGRYEDPVEKAATEWNLHKAGYDGWQKLVMRPDSSHGLVVSDFKSAARENIEGDGFTIIANIGDQLSDLVGGHAEKCFKIPNPFYFIPGAPVPDTGLNCMRR
jgi:hypothetical protein